MDNAMYGVQGVWVWSMCGCRTLRLCVMCGSGMLRCDRDVVLFIPHRLSGNKIQVNPALSGGVRGTVWADDRMRHIVESGGVVESPIPCLPNIQHTYAIR